MNLIRKIKDFRDSLNRVEGIDKKTIIILLFLAIDASIAWMGAKDVYIAVSPLFDRIMFIICLLMMIFIFIYEIFIVIKYIINDIREN